MIKNSSCIYTNSVVKYTNVSNDITFDIIVSLIDSTVTHVQMYTLQTICQSEYDQSNEIQDVMLHLIQHI